MGLMVFVKPLPPVHRRLVSSNLLFDIHVVHAIVSSIPGNPPTGPSRVDFGGEAGCFGLNGWEDYS